MSIQLKWAREAGTHLAIESRNDFANGLGSSGA
jgi:hypothetical protein